MKHIAIETVQELLPSTLTKLVLGTVVVTLPHVGWAAPQICVYPSDLWLGIDMYLVKPSRDKGEQGRYTESAALLPFQSPRGEEEGESRSSAWVRRIDYKCWVLLYPTLVSRGRCGREIARLRDLGPWSLRASCDCKGNPKNR